MRSTCDKIGLKMLLFAFFELQNRFDNTTANTAMVWKCKLHYRRNVFTQARVEGRTFHASFVLRESQTQIPHPPPLSEYKRYLKYFFPIFPGQYLFTNKWIKWIATLCEVRSTRQHSRLDSCRLSSRVQLFEAGYDKERTLLASSSVIWTNAGPRVYHKVLDEGGGDCCNKPTVLPRGHL